MEGIDSNAVQMELKYCERCGGLWLRLKGSELIYCPSCAVVLAGIARDPRFLAYYATRHGSTDEPESTNTFWIEGGNA